MDDIQRSSTPRCARRSRRRPPPYALAAIGLNIHFGYTGLLNFGQAGFMLLGAYGFAISITARLAVWSAILVGLAGGRRLRAHPRRPDAEAARRLPGHRHDRRGRDRPAASARSSAASPRASPAAPTGIDAASAATRDPASHAASTPVRPTGDRTASAARSTYSTNGVNGWWIADRRLGRSSRSSPACSSCLLMRSPWGRVLKGIREDEDAVRSLGKNVFAYKMQALDHRRRLRRARRDDLRAAARRCSPTSMGRSLTFFCYTIAAARRRGDDLRARRSAR